MLLRNPHFRKNCPSQPLIDEINTGPTAVGGVLIKVDEQRVEQTLGFENRTQNSVERKHPL
jgi:argininosuccinate lyase